MDGEKARERGRERGKKRKVERERKRGVGERKNRNRLSHIVKSCIKAAA